MSQQESSIASSAGQSAPPPDTSATAAAQSDTPSDFQSAVAAADELFRSSRQAPADEGTESPDLSQPEPKSEPKEDEPLQVAEEVSDVDSLLADEQPKTEDSIRAEIEKLFPRNSSQLKERAISAEIARINAESKLHKLGSESDIGFVSEHLLPALRNPQPKAEDADALLASIFDANPPLQVHINQALANAVWSVPELYQAYRDGVFKREFSKFPEATKEHIEKLLQWEQDKMFDPAAIENDYKELPTAREQAQADKITQLEARLNDRDGKDRQFEEERERTRQQALQQANQYTEKFVTETVMQDVLPLAKTLGWIVPEGKENTVEGKGLIQLADMLTVYLNEKVKSHPEYSTVEMLKKGGHAWGDGQPTHLLRSNATPLSTRGLTLFKEVARNLQPFFKTKFFQTKSTPKPNPQTPRPAPPVAQAQQGNGKSFAETIAEIDNNYTSVVRDAKAQAGMR